METDMELLKRFLAYYTAFEKTYVDDDWSRLEALFAPDAVYRITGTGAYDCELRGRDAVFTGIRKFLDGFDRRCVRRLESIDPPVVEGSRVVFRGAAIYTRGESPPLRLELTEMIDYRDGQIERISDVYDESWKDGPPAVIAEWLRKYAGDLTLSYV
jgi:hypothetical protein